MIDLHCHILPALDDGAQTEEDLVNMANAAIADGISTIVATPHHQNGSFNNTRNTLRQRTNEANNLLDSLSINLTILPGQECRIYGELVEDSRSGDIQTLADSRYLFVEFPSNSVPRFSKKIFYDLQLEGIIPVIVHPERNTVLMKQPEMLYEFVKNGCLTQVTAASVAGKFGKGISQFSSQIIEANLAHFVATDAHNITNRSFHLNEAYDAIEEEFGEEKVSFFIENAECVLANEYVAIEQPKHVQKRKKFLGLF